MWGEEGGGEGGVVPTHQWRLHRPGGGRAAGGAKALSSPLPKLQYSALRACVKTLLSLERGQGPLLHLHHLHLLHPHHHPQLHHHDHPTYWAGSTFQADRKALNWSSPESWATVLTGGLSTPVGQPAEGTGDMVREAQQQGPDAVPRLVSRKVWRMVCLSQFWSFVCPEK